MHVGCTYIPRPHATPCVGAVGVMMGVMLSAADSVMAAAIKALCFLFSSHLTHVLACDVLHTSPPPSPP